MKDRGASWAGLAFGASILANIALLLWGLTLAGQRMSLINRKVDANRAESVRWCEGQADWDKRAMDEIQALRMRVEKLEKPTTPERP